MAYTNPQDPSCPNCNKTGLAILPVRYAVVPNDIPGDIPAPLGNKVTNVKLAHYKYALRTLRQGYVYLYYERHPTNVLVKWEVYEVTPDGLLWKQKSPLPAGAAAASVCSRSGHNLPASVINLEYPDKGGRVWMAFSSRQWSEETLKELADKVDVRDKRMQTFNPEKWTKGSSYKHGLAATQASIENVVEYNPGFDPDSLNGGQKPGKISRNDKGEFNTKTLEFNTTAHLAVPRKGQSKDLLAVMEKVCEHAKGKPFKPLIIALWDSMGIAQELNNFRNEPAGWIDAYYQEMALQIHGMTAITGLQELMTNNAQAQVRQYIVDVDSREPQIDSTVEARQYAQARLSGAALSRRMEVLDAIDELRSQGISSVLGYDARIRRAETLPDVERRKVIDEVKREAAAHAEVRKRSKEKMIQEAAKNAWPKYQKKLNMAAFNTFKKNYDAFQAAADKLIDNRTGDLIAVLESSVFLDGLEEFSDKNLLDGLEFEDHVGTATFAMNTTIKGRQKIEAWIKEFSVNRHNMLWRILALNQEAATTELNKILPEVRTHMEERAEAKSIEWYGYFLKSLKATADLYKKAAGVYTANEKAKAGTNVAFGVSLKSFRQGGVDKFVVTYGDMLFKFFSVPSKMMNMACETIIQSIFLLRSGAEVAKTAFLANTQAQLGAQGRMEQIQRMDKAKTPTATDVPEVETPTAKKLKAAWDGIKPEGKVTPMRDARMAFVVMLVEGFNFKKLMHEFKEKGDAKSGYGLAASAATLAAGVVDIWAVAVKETEQVTSTAYQKLKLAGGILSVAATTISIGLDLQDAAKAAGKGQQSLRYLYYTKAFAGGMNVVATGLSTFTYAAPTILRVTGKAALADAAATIGGRAASVLACRILFMSAGMWIGVTIFFVQALIWYLSDDALQTWCSLCVFGLSRDAGDAYHEINRQQEGLAMALIEVGA